MRTTPGLEERPRFALPAPVALTSLRDAEAVHRWAVLRGVDVPAERPSAVVRDVVWQSWRRSAAGGVDPAAAGASLVWSDGVADRLAASPLAGIPALLQRLLVDDVRDDGMLVVLTDADGRVLWVDGHRGMRRRAESVLLVEGAGWAEDATGTTAPGLALRTGRCVQVHRFEHWLTSVQAFSCTAAPLVDPVTGVLLGCLDITGGDHVATPAVQAMVRAAAAAVESELRWTRQSERRRARSVVAEGTDGALLQVLGRDRGVLRLRGRSTELSRRHTELLLALVVAAEAGGGRSAEELALDCWESEAPTVTVRAEMARLRPVLGALVQSRPYRLTQPVGTDASGVLALLRRGAHRLALEAYAGPLLPHSAAPVVVRLRDRTHRHLREALLVHGQADQLVQFAELHAPDDVEVWRAVVGRLPAGTPRQTQAWARLTELERRFG